MSDDGRKLEIEISARAKDTAAIAETSSKVRDLRKATDEVKGANRAAGEAEAEQGSAMDKLREQATEGRHALHGAHLAIEGLSRASMGGMDAIRGLSFAMRGLAMSASAGIFGALAIGITGAIELWNKHKEKVEEQKKVIEQFDTAIEGAKPDINEILEISAKLAEPADNWKKSLEDANTALDSSLATIKSVNDQMQKILDAQEKLDLAKLEERRDLEPEEKESAKFGLRAFYSGLRKQGQEGIYNAEIGTEEEKIRQASEAQDRAREEAAKRKDDAVKADEAKKHYSQQLEAMRDFNARSDDDIAKQFAKERGIDLDADRHSPAYQRVLDLYAEIRKTKEGNKNFLSGGSDEELKRLQAEAAATKDRDSAAQKELEQQTADTNKVFSTSTLKISQLQREKDAAKQVSDLQQQQAAQEEADRKREVAKAAEKKALKEKEDHDKAIQAALDQARDEQWKEVEGGTAGAGASAADLSRGALGPAGTLGGSTASGAAVQSVRDAEQHVKQNFNTQTLEELAKAHLAFAQTAVAKIQHLDGVNKQFAAQILRLEQQLKNNRPGGT